MGRELPARPVRRSSSPGAWAAGGALIAAVFLRVALIASARPTFDLESWQSVLATLRQGKDLYGGTPYNYSPLWAGALLAVEAASRALRISFPALIHAVLFLVDVGTAFLVRSLALRRGKTPPQASLAGLLFLANPVSILASSHLYTFDNLPVAFLLAALLSTARPKRRNGETVGWLSLSLLAKHVAWFHPLLFARPRGRAGLSWRAALLPYAVFLVSFAPFLRQARGIRDQVFRYRGIGEDYGTEALRSAFGLPREATTVLFVLAALAAVLLLRRVELGRACLLLFLVVLIFTPGICAYYFAWPIALGALFPSAGYFVYTLVVAGFFLKSPDVVGLDWPHLPGWWGCLWATVFWLLWELRARARASAPQVASS